MKAKRRVRALELDLDRSRHGAMLATERADRLTAVLKEVAQFSKRGDDDPALLLERIDAIVRKATYE